MSTTRHPLQPVADRLGRLVARTGVTPTTLTLTSVVVAGLAAWLLATGRFILAPFVFAVAGAFDFLDGAVARETGRVSRAGGYLDSLMDRYVDFLVLFGLMLAYDTTWVWVVGSVALFGTLMTSGAKWRIHEDHHPTADEWGGRDLLERTDRLLLLLPAILVQGLLDHFATDTYRVVPWVLLLVAVLANLTVLQRIRKAYRILRTNR